MDSKLLMAWSSHLSPGNNVLHTDGNRKWPNTALFGNVKIHVNVIQADIQALSVIVMLNFTI